MDSTDAKKQALQIIADVAEKSASELQNEQNLLADLGIDSPKALKLLMDLEDGLNLEISDEDAARMETVGDILRFVGSAA
ncbi:MAG: phosphopantetheine-binding protein [Thermoanaerobaculia bacterium]|nr:phosphopantetheine-binding protein [Thermoanaerobaculia bacterium]